MPTAQGSAIGLALGNRAAARQATQSAEGTDAVVRGLGPAPMAPYSTLSLSRHRPYTLELCEDPKSRCHYAPRVIVAGGGAVTVGGTWDVTDEWLRLVGDDPYRHEKARFLAATASLRGRMRDEVRGRALREALARLPATLEAIWNEPGVPMEERRVRIVAVADEASGQPGEEQVRAAVKEFLRRKGDAAGKGGPEPAPPEARR